MQVKEIEKKIDKLLKVYDKAIKEDDIFNRIKSQVEIEKLLGQLNPNEIQLRTEQQ